jgi:hypothetical protein
MKIREFVFEISANERERRRKEAALRARQDQAAREEQQRREMLKRQQRQIQKIQQKVDPNAPVKGKAAPAQPAGPFSDPRFDIYRVSDVDTSFEGGNYLNFEPDINTGNIIAYWGKNIENLQQAKMVTQARDMGKVFNATKFQALVDEIINKTTVGEHEGYCHINLPEKLISHPYMGGTSVRGKFYPGLFSYLLEKYPQGEYQMNSNVHWEKV